MPPQSFSRLGRGQNGSITVMVSLLLPIMILMLVMIININQVIFQKIKLQATVDACALSAAAVQAAGLNEIADLNADLATESRKLMGFLMSGTWFDRQNARNAISFFSNGASGVLDHIYRYQMDANQAFALKSDLIAQGVKNLNMPECQLIARHTVDKLASFSVTENEYFYTYYQVVDKSPFTPPVPTVFWINPDNPRFIGPHNGSFVMPAKRTLPIIDSVMIPYELIKTSTAQVRYEIILPSHRFILGNNLFNPIPEIRARARAKPAGGYISGGIPTYEAVLVR